MIKIEIRTENIAGDEELADALRHVIDSIEDGDVEGEIEFDGETYQFAVNPATPLIGRR